MDLQTIIFLLLLGLAAGMLSGLVGIGGGIIIVPGLVYLLGFSQKLAQGTSLAILLLPVGILAVWQFYKADFIDVKAAGFVALAFVIGGYFGSRITLSLPQDTVKKIFAILLLCISIKMLFFDKMKSTAIQKTTSSIGKIP